MQGNYFSPDLQSFARALGGEISRGQVLCPGPGHSPPDRSLAVKLDAGAPDGFVVYSFASDDPIQCRDFVRERCGLPRFTPNGNGHRRATGDEIAAMVASAVASQRPDKVKRPSVIYPYTDAAGTLL